MTAASEAHALSKVLRAPEPQGLLLALPLPQQGQQGQAAARPAGAGSQGARGGDSSGGQLGSADGAEGLSRFSAKARLLDVAVQLGGKRTATAKVAEEMAELVGTGLAYDHSGALRGSPEAGGPAVGQDSKTSPGLLAAQPCSTAPHAAEVPGAVKDLVRQAYDAGAVSVICATSTLATSVNLPCGVCALAPGTGCTPACAVGTSRNVPC